MTKLNTGLSGCSLELINDRVLRKYSPTTDYNSRLLSQADKQMVFGNRIYKNIDAPKVYDTQENYFDMEYIAGKSFEEFFSIASVNDVEFVVSTLFDYFDTLISTARNIDATKLDTKKWLKYLNEQRKEFIKTLTSDILHVKIIFLYVIYLWCIYVFIDAITKHHLFVCLRQQS